MSRRAFTANELMMVLLMIAIMSAVVARFTGVGRERARQADCESNVKQLAVALRMYGADNDGRFPVKPKDADAIMPYTKNRQIFSCPTADRKTLPEGQYEVDYLFNPALRSDDLPSLILLGEDAPSRHRGGWIGARLDGAAAWWPASEYEKMLGRVTKDEPHGK